MGRTTKSRTSTGESKFRAHESKRRVVALRGRNKIKVKSTGSRV